jgi:hypothetical protein
MSESVKVKGILTIIPMKTPIDSGATVLYDPEDGSQLQAGTVEHIDSENRYYIMGTYESYTVPDPILNRFVVVDNMSRQWPLKFNDWYKVIKNKIPLHEERDWHVTPLKFREGKYHQCCTECNGYFLGAKSQPYCKPCCEELAYASITSEKKYVKEKRPRLINPNIVDIMLKECYQAGVDGVSWEQINKRVKNKLKDGSYRIKSD